MEWDALSFEFVCRAFIAGGIAACGAVTVTHSFETVKIRYDHYSGRQIGSGTHARY